MGGIERHRILAAGSRCLATPTRRPRSGWCRAIVIHTAGKSTAMGFPPIHPEHLRGSYPPGPFGMGSCIQQVTRPGVPAMRMTRLKDAEADSVPQEKQWRPPGFSALGGSTSKSGAGVCVLPVRPLSYTLDVTWPPSGTVPVLPLKSTLARWRATLCVRWATTLPPGRPPAPAPPALPRPQPRRWPKTAEYTGASRPRAPSTLDLESRVAHGPGVGGHRVRPPVPAHQGHRRSAALLGTALLVIGTAVVLIAVFYRFRR